MINILASGGDVVYRVQEFAIDTETDLKYLPKDIAPGSTAICIDTSEVYMLNGSKEWVKL